MAEAKTKPTDADVGLFLAGIADEQRRRDCLAVAQMMKRVTRAQPTMWGTSIVGFGSYRYKYASGREGDWPLLGFSPRKQDLTLYLMAGVGRFSALLKQLGKHKAGKGCLYIKRLSDVDTKVLEELLRASVAHSRQSGA